MICQNFGSTQETNMIYDREHFRSDLPQVFLLPLDLTSMYGFALQKVSMPVAGHEFHGESSDLVHQLNRMLEDAEFLAYLKNHLPRRRYFLIEVSIEFSPEVQDRLVEFVPTVRRGNVDWDQLSKRQRELIKILGMKYDPQISLVLSDFAPQKGSFSLDYLELLVSLGVTITRVHSVVISVSCPIFARVMQKILDLRRLTSDGFARGWFKLVANSG